MSGFGLGDLDSQGFRFGFGFGRWLGPFLPCEGLAVFGVFELLLCEPGLDNHFDHCAIVRVNRIRRLESLIRV